MYFIHILAYLQRRLWTGVVASLEQNEVIKYDLRSITLKTHTKILTLTSMIIKPDGNLLSFPLFLRRHFYSTIIRLYSNLFNIFVSRASNRTCSFLLLSSICNLFFYFIFYLKRDTCLWEVLKDIHSCYKCSSAFGICQCHVVMCVSCE